MVAPNAAAVLGLVHTQDVGLASDAIEQGLWTPQDAASADLPARFGYVRSPMQGAPMKKAAIKKAGQ
jgi:hypothetical protein